MVATKANMRSDDRVIELNKIDGKHTIGTNGLVDNRLFTGENKLHAAMEPNGLWYVYYDKGFVEPALRVKFTNFPALMKFLVDHYRKRNIQVREILD